MWAVYLCGSTDCFLHAMFSSEALATEWAAKYGINPEGYRIVFWKDPSEIDKTDTGWMS